MARDPLDEPERPPASAPGRTPRTAAYDALTAYQRFLGRLPTEAEMEALQGRYGHGDIDHAVGIIVGSPALRWQHAETAPAWVDEYVTAKLDGLQTAIEQRIGRKLDSLAEAGYDTSQFEQRRATPATGGAAPSGPAGGTAPADPLGIRRP
jgi:hypothetical protein